MPDLNLTAPILSPISQLCDTNDAKNNHKNPSRFSILAIFALSSRQFRHILRENGDNDDESESRKICQVLASE